MVVGVPLRVVHLVERIESRVERIVSTTFRTHRKNRFDHIPASKPFPLKVENYISLCDGLNDQGTPMLLTKRHGRSCEKSAVGKKDS